MATDTRPPDCSALQGEHWAFVSLSLPRSLASGSGTTHAALSESTTTTAEMAVVAEDNQTTATSSEASANEDIVLPDSINNTRAAPTQEQSNFQQQANLNVTMTPSHAYNIYDSDVISAIAQSKDNHVGIFRLVTTSRLTCCPVNALLPIAARLHCRRSHRLRIRYQHASTSLLSCSPWVGAEFCALSCIRK